MPKKLKPMKRIAIFVTQDQLLALKRLYTDTGVRPAETIRRAVDAYLQTVQKERS